MGDTKTSHFDIMGYCKILCVGQWQLFHLLCKGCGFCGAMGNDALWKAVVDVCRVSLVQAQVGAKRGTEAILLHMNVSEPEDRHPQLTCHTHTLESRQKGGKVPNAHQKLHVRPGEPPGKSSHSIHCQHCAITLSFTCTVTQLLL